MKSYLNSFLITLFIYLFLGFGFFYTFFDEKKFLKKEESKKMISLSHVEIKKQKEIKKKVLKQKKVIKKKPIIKPKKVKKEVKKKLVKRAKKPIIKPIKKEPTKKVEEKIVEVVKPKRVAKVPKKQVTIEKKKNSTITEEKSYINKNLLKIREAIQESIKYPKRARLFEIQGKVFVRFDILKDGNVKNIVILKGHRLLTKATIKAIKEASKKFTKTKKSLTIELPIEYRLK